MRETDIPNHVYQINTQCRPSDGRNGIGLYQLIFAFYHKIRYSCYYL